MAAGEVRRFADHDRPDAKLTYEPTAVPTRRKSRNHNGFAVVAAPACVTEGAGLGVSRRVPVLDATVVAPAQAVTGPVKQRRPDRYAALAKAGPSLFDGDGQHGAGALWRYRLRI